MRGLRTPESKSFMNFFALVQEEAGRQKSVFFLDSGDGHDLHENDLDGEDLFGWLIPDGDSSEFETAFLAREALDKWDEHQCFAVWEHSGNQILISFE